jgi:uncharacterized protein YciI
MDVLWIVICTDKPESAAKRAELLLEHRQYLDGKKDMIFFSGPQESDDGSEMIGSVFIVNAPTRADAQGFIDGETFHRAGIFESVVIRRLRKGRLNPELATTPS